MPYPGRRDEDHQLRLSSPVREGTCFSAYPWGWTMWIHPDLLDEILSWTTVSRKKSRGKTKKANVILASTTEPDSDVNSLTNSEEEEEVLAASVTRPLAAATRSGQLYLRN